MPDSLDIKVLMITTEWPSPDSPFSVPFLVQQVESLRSLGVEVEVYHFRGKKNPIRYLKAWVEIRKLHKINQFDLIHAQWGQSGLLALPKTIPLVVTFRGSDVDGIRNKKGKMSFFGALLTQISTFVAKNADEIIVVSEHLAKKLNITSYHLIPSGIDLDKFKPIDKLEARVRLGLSEDQKIVLFIGNPEIIDKRYELAWLAVDNVNKRFRDVELLVLYDKPQDQVPLIMNACDVLLVTSSHEGSPNIVKEALACNLPIVSVDVGDVKERIQGIDGCYLCSEDKVEVIANYLKRALIKKSQINGRETIYDLDWNIIANKILAIYYTCL